MIRNFERVFKGHFASIIFLAQFSIIFLSIFLADYSLAWSSIMALAALAFSALYYYLYLDLFRDKLSLPIKRVYVYDVFSGWWLAVFCMLNIFSFAAFGASLEWAFPGLFFGSVTVFDIFFHYVFLLIDFILIGMPSTLGWELGSIVVTNLGGLLYVFITTLAFKLFFLAAVLQAIKERFEINELVMSIFNRRNFIKRSDLNGHILNFISGFFIDKKSAKRSKSWSHKFIAVAQRYYSADNKISSKAESIVFEHLSVGKTKSSRDLALLMAQSTSDDLIFVNNIKYLISCNDRRVYGLRKIILDDYRLSVLKKLIYQKSTDKLTRRL